MATFNYKLVEKQTGIVHEGTVSDSNIPVLLMKMPPAVEVSLGRSFTPDEVSRMTMITNIISRGRLEADNISLGESLAISYRCLA